WRGMRLVVETLLASLPSLGNVLLFGGFQFGLFGILGVQLFAGKLSVCSQTSIDGVPVTERSQCVEGVAYVCSEADLCYAPGEAAVRWWGPPMRNFDHLGRAALTLFTVSTLDGYMEVARMCIDSVGVDKVPRFNNSPALGLYIIAFVFLGAFFWVNLLVSVIIDHYAHIAQQGDLLGNTKQVRVSDAILGAVILLVNCFIILAFVAVFFSRALPVAQRKATKWAAKARKWAWFARLWPAGEGGVKQRA
ncbi:Sodium channel protein 1 brain, partial [Tetrabaena socialis]